MPKSPKCVIIWALNEIGGILMKRKNKKRISLIAIILLLATVATSILMPTTEAQGEAPSSFVVYNASKLPNYIADIAPSQFSTSVGGYASCNDIHKKDPVGQTMTLVGEASPGITYIFANGFPNKSITGNSDYDSYITRVAVWWYLDETTGSNNLSDGFKNSAPDPYGLKPYIIDLVNGAKKTTSYPTPSLKLNNEDANMQLSADKKYYESNAISVTATSVSGNYTVSISGAPEGTVVVNASSGASQTSFATNESFKVRVPVSSVEEMTNTIKITASATGVVNKAYEYAPSSSEYQNMYQGLLYPSTTNLSATTEVTLTTSKVTITKIDANTGTTLAGATFELLDSEGKTITSWTSTTNAHVIRNLPNGTYTLKETSAPKGYKLKEESVKITITDKNRDIKVEMENEPISKLVNIIKIDKSTGNPLAGAQLIVKNEKGETIAEFTTTEEQYTITDLEDGTYTVEEVSAPSGYKKTDEVYTFTISDENPTAEIVVENYPEVVVPSTGSHISMLPTIFGAIILISGVGFVYYNGKKEQQ